MHQRLDAQDVLALAGTDRATRATVLGTPAGAALLSATLRRGPAALRVAPLAPARTALEEVGGRAAARRALLDPTRAIPVRVFARPAPRPASRRAPSLSPTPPPPLAAPLAAIAGPDAASAMVVAAAMPAGAASPEVSRLEVVADRRCPPALRAEQVARRVARRQAEPGARVTWAPDRTYALASTPTGVFLVGPGGPDVALPEAGGDAHAVFGPGGAAVVLRATGHPTRWRAYNAVSGALVGGGDGTPAFVGPATLALCARTDAGLTWTTLPLPGIGLGPDLLPTLTRASTTDAVAAWGGTLPEGWLLDLAMERGRRGGAQLAGDGTRLALATQRLLEVPTRGQLTPMAMDVLVVDRVRGTTLMFRDVQRSYRTCSDVTWLWAASGRRLALASGTALGHEASCLFDLEAGRQVALAATPGTGAPLAFSPSEAILACAAAPGTVALYDAASGALLRPTGAQTPAPPAWSPAERRVAFDGGADGVRVLYLDRRPPPSGPNSAGQNPRDVTRQRARRNLRRAVVATLAAVAAGCALIVAVEFAAGLSWPLMAASALAGAVWLAVGPLARAWRQHAAAVAPCALPGASAPWEL